MADECVTYKTLFEQGQAIMLEAQAKKQQPEWKLVEAVRDCDAGAVPVALLPRRRKVVTPNSLYITP